MIANLDNIPIDAYGKCKSCGASVPLLNLQAAHLYASRGIVCKDCRRKPEFWWTVTGYAEYLQTEHWQHVRLRALQRAGHKCAVCASRVSLQVHHNDYSRLGGELATDTVVLCDECHTLFHGREL